MALDEVLMEVDIREVQDTVHTDISAGYEDISDPEDQQHKEVTKQFEVHNRICTGYEDISDPEEQEQKEVSKQSEVHSRICTGYEDISESEEQEQKEVSKQSEVHSRICTGYEDISDVEEATSIEPYTNNPLSPQSSLSHESGFYSPNTFGSSDCNSSSETQSLLRRLQDNLLYKVQIAEDSPSVIMYGTNNYTTSSVVVSSSDQVTCGQATNPMYVNNLAQNNASGQAVSQNSCPPVSTWSYSSGGGVPPQPVAARHESLPYSSVYPESTGNSSIPGNTHSAISGNNMYRDGYNSGTSIINTCSNSVSGGYSHTDYSSLYTTATQGRHITHTVTKATGTMSHSQLNQLLDNPALISDHLQGTNKSASSNVTATPLQKSASSTLNRGPGQLGHQTTLLDSISSSAVMGPEQIGHRITLPDSGSNTAVTESEQIAHGTALQDSISNIAVTGPEQIGSKTTVQDSISSPAGVEHNQIDHETNSRNTVNDTILKTTLRSLLTERSDEKVLGVHNKSPRETDFSLLEGCNLHKLDARSWIELLGIFLEEKNPYGDNQNTTCDNNTISSNVHMISLDETEGEVLDSGIVPPCGGDTHSSSPHLRSLLEGDDPSPPCTSTPKAPSPILIDDDIAPESCLDQELSSHSQGDSSLVQEQNHHDDGTSQSNAVVQSNDATVSKLPDNQEGSKYINTLPTANVDGALSQDIMNVYDADAPQQGQCSYNTDLKVLNVKDIMTGLKKAISNVPPGNIPRIHETSVAPPNLQEKNPEGMIGVASNESATKSNGIIMEQWKLQRPTQNTDTSPKKRKPNVISSNRLGRVINKEAKEQPKDKFVNPGSAPLGQVDSFPMSDNIFPQQPVITSPMVHKPLVGSVLVPAESVVVPVPTSYKLVPAPISTPITVVPRNSAIPAQTFTTATINLVPVVTGVQNNPTISVPISNSAAFVPVVTALPNNPAVPAATVKLANVLPNILSNNSGRFNQQGNLTKIAQSVSMPSATLSASKNLFPANTRVMSYCYKPTWSIHVDPTSNKPVAPQGITSSNNHQRLPEISAPPVGSSLKVPNLSNVTLNTVSDSHGKSKGYFMFLSVPQKETIEEAIKAPTAIFFDEKDPVIQSQIASINSRFTVVEPFQANIPHFPDPTFAAVAPNSETGCQILILGPFSNKAEGHKWFHMARKHTVKEVTSE